MEPLATVADVELRLDDCVDDTAHVAALLADASSLARAIADAPISVETVVAEPHDGCGIYRLRPRNALVSTEGTTPVLTVAEIRISGTIADPSTYVVKPEAGTVHRRSSPWPNGLHNVEIDYDAGFDPIPAWVVAIVAGAVLRVLSLPSGAPAPLQSESWGDHSLSFMSLGTGSTGSVVGFTKLEEARLASLSARLPGFA